MYCEIVKRSCARAYTICVRLTVFSFLTISMRHLVYVIPSTQYDILKNLPFIFALPCIHLEGSYHIELSVN